MLTRLKKALACFFVFELVFASWFLFVGHAFALTTVSGLTSQPTSLVAGETSNQSFLFTLGATWDVARALTLTFPAEFTTSTITEDDVDVSAGGVDLSTAATCAGTEQASVAMSSNILTVTLCLGDASAISSGQLISIEIGTNAAGYGSGTHKITNPSSAGTYYVDLGGNFGEFGSIPVPIVSSSAPGVTATVSQGVSEDTGGGGGGGGGGGSSTGGDTSSTDGNTQDSTPDVPPTLPDDGQTTPTDPSVPSDTTTDTNTDTSNTDTSDNTSNNSSNSSSGQNSGSNTGSGSNGGANNGSNSDSSGQNNGGSSGGNATETKDVQVSVDFVIGDLVLPQSGSLVNILPTVPVTIRVNVESVTEPETVTAIVGEDTYVLSPVTGRVFEGIVLAPAVSTNLSVVVTTKDGQEQIETTRLQSEPYGQVFEVKDGARVPIPYAVLTVYYVEGGGRTLWNGAQSGEANPKTSTEEGFFAWYVPNGQYIVVADRDGYEEISAVIQVRNGILAPSIEMQRLTGTSVSSSAGSNSSPIAKVLAPLQNILNIQASPVVQETLQKINEVLDSPEAEAVADVALPATAAAATSSAVVLTSSFNLLPYLQYLLTSPFLLFSRRKRKNYGTVYHAMTKVPIELAIVRLYRLSDNRLMKTAVTNSSGRYFLFVSDPGEYRLLVTKTGFVFPSAYLSDTREDGVFHDVYTSQTLTVTEKDATISANIPLDPSEAVQYHGVHGLKRKRFLRALQRVVAPLGFLLSLYVYLVLPSPLSGTICLLQFFTLLISIRLAWPKKAKGWGMVSAKENGKPLGNVVVRLFEPRYNKLVESTLTDSRGRYSFLLGANEYFASFDKEPYQQKIVRPIDYRDRKEPAPLTVNVALDHR